MLTGLSQRVAYFYPTGVTLLHTSSPSSLRARLRAVAWAWVCIEVTWAPVAGWGLVRHRARLHQPWRRAQLGQEEHPGPEPCLLGRGAPVVAWQGRRSTIRAVDEIPPCKILKHKIINLYYDIASFIYFISIDYLDVSTAGLESTKRKLKSLEIEININFVLPEIHWDFQFSFQDGVKFVSIGAMFSELVAVSSKGELYQWKWSEPEPYRNAQVCTFNMYFWWNASAKYCDMLNF